MTLADLQLAGTPGVHLLEPSNPFTARYHWSPECGSLFADDLVRGKGWQPCSEDELPTDGWTAHHTPSDYTKRPGDAATPPAMAIPKADRRCA